MEQVSKHISTKLNNYKTLYLACLMVAILFGGLVASNSDLVWFEQDETPVIQVNEVQAEPIRDLETEERQKLVDVVDPQKTNNTRIVQKLNALL